MKQQPYPASKIKVGNVMYSAIGWTDDEGKAHLDIDEWCIRTIQNRKISQYTPDTRVVISLVCKLEGVTWIKEAWSKNFPAHYRKKLFENSPLPHGIYTTKLQALRHQLHSTQENITDLEADKAKGNWSDEHEREYNEELKVAKVIKSRITRLRNEARKATEKRQVNK